MNTNEGASKDLTITLSPFLEPSLIHIIDVFRLHLPGLNNAVKLAKLVVNFVHTVPQDLLIDDKGILLLFDDI
jgi:hypothetical protein